MFLTEDKVREKAKEILGFEETESVICGVGQLTTFNQLGFKGVPDKPDGWYLPKEHSFPAIILEVKASHVSIRQPHIDELIKNCLIAESKYKDVIGILWNSEEIVIIKNGEQLKEETELKNKEYQREGSGTYLVQKRHPRSIPITHRDRDCAKQTY